MHMHRVNSLDLTLILGYLYSCLMYDTIVNEYFSTWIFCGLKGVKVE